MTEKTELEFGGATITGGKILLLVPLLGAIGGSMWGGFEVCRLHPQRARDEMAEHRARKQSEAEIGKGWRQVPRPRV